MNDVCLRIRYGFNYMKAKDKYLFYVASLLGVIGIIMMMCCLECSVLIGIGQSIFAAYIFYVFLEFLPKISLAYDESYQEKCAYELLRILLVRLDDLFIEPFKQVYKKQELPNLEEFFSEKVLLDFLRKFNVCKAESISSFQNTDGTMHPLKFFQSIQHNWNEIQEYIQYLTLIPYTRENNEFFYQLQYLKFDSPISMYFKFHSFSKSGAIPYSFIIGDSQNANGDYQIQKKAIENVVRLHKIAFDIYKRLRNDQRWNEIFPPTTFYEN